MDADELAASLGRYAAGPRRPHWKEGGVYAKRDYWDRRFTNDDTGSYDWYVSYEELEPVLTEHAPSSGAPSVLMVGCGNSGLSGTMYDAGYQSITNIDISEAVVEKMEQECAREGMKWLVMDATAMRFADACFDLAIEKGTVDALMSDRVNMPSAIKLVAETWRTLKVGGLLVLVSHSRWRGELLDESVRQCFGPGAAWELVEARWNRLSDQATLINLIRSLLRPGQTFNEGFRDPAVLIKVGLQSKKVIKLLLLMDLFRSRRRMKEKKAAEAASRDVDVCTTWQRPSENPPAEPQKHWEEEDVCGPDKSGGRRQPFCYVYVVRKRLDEHAN